MDIKEALKNHLDKENKLLLYPSKRKLKVAAMFYITYGFEGDRRYTEKEINEIIISLAISHSLFSIYKETTVVSQISTTNIGCISCFRSFE